MKRSIPEVHKVIEIYVALVREGKRTLDQVPERYRAEVQSILEGEETNG